MTTTHRTESATRHGPAESWLWAFILADMRVFAIFFATFLWEFGEDPSGFRREAASLALPLGVANTLVLLLSSYVVVCAVGAHRASEWPLAQRYLRWALAGAALFVCSKSIEYALEISDGHGLTTSPFFMYYFVLTGLHLMHVAIGSGLLAAWRHSLRRGRPLSTRWAESAGAYWHMVDLLWIVIFSFCYIGSHA